MNSPKQLPFAAALLLTAWLTPTFSAEPSVSIQSVLDATQGKAEWDKSVTVTLQWSKNDHPPNTHGYQAFAKKWKGLLEQIDGVTCVLAEGFPDAEQWKKSDLVIVYLTQKMLDDKKFAIMDAYQQGGGSLMVLHQGLVQRKRCQDWADRIGIAYQFVEPHRSKWGPHDEPVTLDTKHPIFNGFPATIQYKDELYWNLIKGTRGKVEVIGHTRFPQQDADDPTESPVFWTMETEQGARVFGCVIGHWDTYFDEPFFRTALLRGTAWCLNAPFEPFKPLVER